MSLREFQRDRMNFASRADWKRNQKSEAAFEQIVAQFQAPYDDPERRAWIARRLREWKERTGR